MARPGSWDVTGFGTTWFDVTGDVSGWMDWDFIPFPAPPTPPTPPVPPAPPPRPTVTGGGGFRILDPLPEPCVIVPVPHEPEPVEKRDEQAFALVCPSKEEDADYAVFPIGQDARIKALEDGIVEHKTASNGQLVIVLRADTGVSYVYVNIGRYVGDPRRVKAGEVIGLAGPWTTNRVEREVFPVPELEPEAPVGVAALEGVAAEEIAEEVAEEVALEGVAAPDVSLARLSAKFVAIGAIALGAGIVVGVLVSAYAKPRELRPPLRSRVSHRKRRS